MRRLSIPPICWDCGLATGILVLLLQLSTARMPLGEARDWFQYYAVGGGAILFVLSGVVGGWIRRHSVHWLIRGFGAIRIAFTLYAVLALSVYFIPPIARWPFVSGWAVALLIAWRWLKQLRAEAFSKRLLWGAGMMWFLLCAFCICLKLLPMDVLFPASGNENAWKYALTLVAGLGFAWLAVWNLPGAAKPLRTPYKIAAHAVILILLGLVCFRTSYPMNMFGNIANHWKAILEPAEAVRSGGWLLWDVPAQYGFLQPLTLALLPVKNSWQALYLVNAALCILASYMLFLALPSSRNFLAYLFCVALTLACTLLQMLQQGADFRMLPSGGPLRFFWVYAMTGYVFCLTRADSTGPEKPFRRYYLPGNLLWLAAALWSLESAVYVSLIWIPSLALIALARNPQANPALPAIGKHLLACLSYPVVLFAGALLCITLYYLTFLGHAPDFAIYLDYAPAYKNGFSALPIDRLGGVACLLFIFCLMLVPLRAALAFSSSRKGLMNAAALYAPIAGLWAISSYYVSRSDEIHIINLTPIMVYLAALVWRMTLTAPLPVPIREAYKAGMIFLFGLALTGAAVNPNTYFDNMLRRPPGDITKMFPPPPPSLRALMQNAGLPEQARVLVLAQDYAPLENVYLPGIRPWLLANTIRAYGSPLPHETYAILTERNAMRGCASGWIIESVQDPMEHYPWIQKPILTYYRQVGLWQNTDWRIRRFEKLKPARC